MGPEAGRKGRLCHRTGGASLPIEANSASQIGPFLAGTAETKLRCCTEKETLFANGTIHLSTDSIHTVKPLEVDIPKGRLTVVTGVSGSGKTTMVLESLIPALEATHRWQCTASAYPHRFGRRHRACQAHRRDADWHQRPLDGRDLCGRA